MKFCVFKFLIVILFLNLLACKSDKEKDNYNSSSIETIKDKSESEKHLENIKRAHNASKFSQEEQVKFKLKLSFENGVFFDGFITLKTNGSKARFLDSNIDKIVESDNISTELEQKLYWLTELYTLGFWLEKDQFNKVNSESEDFIKSIYKSPMTSNIYTIYSHPLTDVIQYVDYKTGLSDQPFNYGVVYFDKYITVNRVPVSLVWEFKLEKDKVAKAEISRISYPDTF